ncbi:alpha/beta hydrolase [Chitinophaga pendula]|uniref:alpha/beta fold hydrolase n=1 Tax=Chitinophaga TaxID=79328 RepID=UPI000BAF8921|nr:MULTISPECIES: alpha/beta fold hydrolase [Chitinophaga]ASZ11737.1 hypothetical protein CK934_12600 [Chitinophaga sp. MD30]UCJ05244.1 alpha/beta hydrolase [Chitinophaga pendula]
MQKDVLPFSLRMSSFFLSRLGYSFPGLTARVFLRLYSTPPGRKLRASQLAFGAQARQERWLVREYAFSERKVGIQGYRWGVSDRKVLLLHGWGGSPLDFRQMVGALVEGGYEVISYDGPAHGASGGKRSNLVQWMYVLQQVLEQVGPVDAIVGHSLGGLNAALTLARTDMKVSRLVMMGSSVSAPAFFNDAFQQYGIPQPVMPKVQALVRRRLRDDLARLDLFQYLEGIHADKILVVSDENDLLVKQQEVEAFLSVYPGIQAFHIKGEGHFRIMRNEAVIREVLAFLGS